MTNYYQDVNSLDTDTFWLLATLALLPIKVTWTAEQVSNYLSNAGYIREDGTPFDVSYLTESLDRLAAEAWLGKQRREVYRIHPLAMRALRQYLLAFFPGEAHDLMKANTVVMVQRGRPTRRGRRQIISQPQASTTNRHERMPWAEVFVEDDEAVVSSLALVRPFPPNSLVQPSSPLCEVCGIYGEVIEVENASIFLPPYPEGYLMEISSEIRTGIITVFATRPQLFTANAHGELWAAAESLLAQSPQLVARAAINFMPSLPPGATPALFERFPDLAVVSAWARGEAAPEADEAPFSATPTVPNPAWHLRAVARMYQNKSTPQALSTAFGYLDYLPPEPVSLSLNTDKELSKEYFDLRGTSPYSVILMGLSLLWAGKNETFTISVQIENELIHPNLAGMPWLRGQLADVLARLCHAKGERKKWAKRAEQAKDIHQFTFFDGLMKPPAEWEHFLRDIENKGAAAGAVKVGGGKPGDKRLVYIFDGRREALIIREQTFGKKGWTPGRQLRLEDLITSATDPADQVIFPAIRTYSGQVYNPGQYGYYYGNTPSSIETGQALYLLAGHPLVFEDDQKRMPLAIERGEPQLVVDHDDEGNLHVKMEPPGLKKGYSLHRTAPGKLTIYHVTEGFEGLTKRLPPSGMTIPAQAAERFERALPKLRKTVNVQSSTDWKDQDLPEIEGRPQPCFHLVPLGDNEHRVEVFIKPLSDGDLYYPPGEGLSKSMVATEEAGRALLVRDLAVEVAAVAACLADCPVLGSLQLEGYDVLLPNDRQTLEVLRELQALATADRAVLEYPKGQRLRLGETVDDEQLRVQVSSGRDWFRVDAGLQLNEDRVIDFELILEGLRNKDKYVKIGEDEYLTLTEGLRDRLGKMDALLSKNRDARELAPLAGAAFAEVLEGLDHVETDLAWRSNLERIAAAGRFVAPSPPPEFLAELRDYQKTGYEWLLRLANWGVGACLADDMGLGKTIQALAVLTHRGADGPALVIAPASVIRNWRTETERFAPTLQPKLIGTAAEAETVLAGAGANDVLLLSFGLLTYVSEALLATPFHTLVVDEAQAIKNPTTQRARAVRDLNADWKIATTGTPIENNLAELWSLFRFLNPGLFGSYKRFREQYENPIVKFQNQPRAEQLRRLVRPFILRRRKGDVLKELPPKTEIVRTVEQGPEEKSLYEALRRKALRDIDAADQQRRRFIVLQQLTQLRQAACHPKLINKRSKVSSAKLAAVGETIQEILDGGHKALVFSQFVGHLKLVEQWVKQQKIPYQYLDGSTPGKTRQQRVEAFQGGEGKLFLISLKAGGTGLNLTEASYVLHLDPWWNPAVEDQASDRAHRMGQLKAVTVYRFVSAGTIEEQILELHATKRDLADRLLEGTDGASSLRVEDVVELLREG